MSMQNQGCTVTPQALDCQAVHLVLHTFFRPVILDDV